MSSAPRNTITLKQMAARAVSWRWTSITRKAPAYATEILRLLTRTSFAGGYFILDIFLQSSTLALILSTLGTNGPTFLSAESVAWQYSSCYSFGWILAASSWAFGYLERTPRIYWFHLGFASLRSSFFLISAALFLHYGVNIRLRGAFEPPFMLCMMVMAALLHLKLAVDRIRRHWKLQAETHINPRDYRLNIMTDTVMSYWEGPSHRSQDIDQAVKYMTSGADEHNKFWYHPLVKISQRKGPKGTEMVEANSTSFIAIETPLFSRCYCCLEDDWDITAGALQHTRTQSNEDTEMLVRRTQWAEQRGLFMQQPRQCHSGYLQTTIDPERTNQPGEIFNPHQLCQKCTYMAENSFLIQLLSGWTWATYRKFLSSAISYKPMVEEDFEHWSTPLQMQTEVESGCHLCTMMWYTLSEEQQKQLLDHDSHLERKMEGKIEQLRLDRNHEEDKVDRIKAIYHRQRSIRLKIRSPSAHKGWATSWAARHSYQSLRLIPHFGGNKVARRWMKEKFARRAISLGQDPTLDWDQEQVDGLEITSTNLDNRGPICIPMSTDSGSDATMRLIRSWLSPEPTFRDERSVERDQQQAARDPDFALQALDETGNIGSRLFRRPTRLIDVGTTEDNTVRLQLSSTIEREDWPERQTRESRRGGYVALSHSWGSHDLLCLTESSLGDFQAGISVSSLPPTFRDAVSVVRRAGQRLLWIDSLCIIQDSKEDWRREATQMKDIYANADFVIAAVASWTSSESFFVPQVPLTANPCLLSVRGELCGLTGNAPRSFGGIYVFPQMQYTEDAWDEIRLSRLCSRAWCYQEERLAKRIVYFGDRQIQMREWTRSGKLLRRKKQVQWISRNDTRVDFPDLLHPPLLQATTTVLRQKIFSLPIFRLFEGRSFRQPSETSFDAGSHGPTRPWSSDAVEADDTSSHSLLTESWWDGVRQYSDRYLTHEEDKLQAFSGIAHLFKSRGLVQDPKLQYLAGLWANDNELFVTGLLWYVSRRPPESKRGQYRAPSWSWASVDGRICNDSLPGSCSARDTGIQILRYWAEGPGMESGSRTAFPLGQCSEGFIAIRGRLQRATWAALEGSQKRYYVERPGDNDYVSHAADLEDFATWSSDPVSGPEGYALLAEDGTCVGYLLPDDENCTPGEVFCLQIIVKSKNKADQEDFAIPWATRGLALVPTDLAPNEFRRIGYFELHKTLGGLSFPHRFSRDRRRARRWPPPNIDVAKFFERSPECEIVIR